MHYESRESIPERYRWDLSSIYESDEAFLAALEKASQWPQELQSHNGSTCSSAKSLLEFLDLQASLSVELGKLVTYAQRRADEDTRDATCQDYVAQVMFLLTQFAASTAWFTPELLALTDEQIEGYYKDEPGLELYRRSIDVVLRGREHVLSAAEELILARASDVCAQPEQIYSLLNDADMTFEPASDSICEPHEVTHGSYIPLMMSKDRELRESAFESMYSAYGSLKNTCAATLGAQAKQLKFAADCRKFASTLEASLWSTEVPPSVYHALVDAVHANMTPMYKYVELRKKALGLKELHYWDLYVPIVADVDMQFAYEEACELMLRALAPLGGDYLQIVRKGLGERWIDVYETPGKRSGAYSAGGFGMHPVILMNYQGKLDDVYTLVHEMGHSVHTYLSCANQPSIYSDYVIFVAEVASTVNEVLLTKHLLATETDPSRHAYVLNHFLEQFRGTLYRQTMFAEFELECCKLAEQGVGITADALCEMYGKLNELYFGSGIVLDEQIKLEWARIPHFYYQYYVYQYATSFAAAVQLAQGILDEGAPAVERYVEFLSSGSSKPPIELLQHAGVDMSTPAPIEQATAQFDSLVDELRELL